MPQSGEDLLPANTGAPAQPTNQPTKQPTKQPTNQHTNSGEVFTQSLK